MSLPRPVDLNDPRQETGLAPRKRKWYQQRASIAGFCMLALALIASLVFGALWMQSRTANAAPAAPEATGQDQVAGGDASAESAACPDGLDELTLVAPERISDPLTAAAKVECIALTLEASPAGSGILTRIADGGVDAWVADSSELAEAVGVPSAEAQPLFLSPIVFEASAPIASLMRGTGGDWRDLALSDAATRPELKFGEDAAGQSALNTLVTRIAERAATASGSDGDPAQLTATLASLAPAADTSASTASLTAITVSELAALSDPTTALTLGPAAALDYPLIVAPGATNERAATAERLVTAVRALSPQQLAKLGYAPHDATSTVIAEAETELLPPNNAEMYMVTSAVLDPSIMQGRLYVYMDASGSMGDAAAGGLSGIEAMQQSVQGISESMPGGMFVEWWSFGMGIGEGTDQVLLDSGTLLETKGRLATTAAGLKALPVGTPLYQTVVEGYRHTLEQSAEAGAPGILVVVTDGKNEDAPGRLGREEALAELATLSADGQGLPILFMGFGDADMAAMEEVVAVTGGKAWKIDQPEQLSTAIVSAVTEVGAAQQQRGWAGVVASAEAKGATATTSTTD